MANPKDPPGKDSNEFQQFIRRKSCNHRFHPESSYCRTWKESPNPETHSSFGDGGTTASVNMFGDIMQFGTYLGIGNSGMFSADHGITDEPFLEQWRARTLELLRKTRLSSMDDSEAYGLQFEDVIFEKPPCLKYLYYRWPRFEYKEKECELTVQWVVHDGIVLQQCICTNLGDAELPISFRFRNDKASMWIRDLDYLDSANHFNDEHEGHSLELGPHGYSCIFMHELKKEEANTTDTNSDEDTGTSTPLHKPPVEFKDEPDSVAVVVSVFLNGEALPWTSECKNNWKKTLQGSESSVEVITAYRMMPMKNSERNWKDFLIPAASTDVDYILQSTPFSNISLSGPRKLTEDHRPNPDSEVKGQEIAEEYHGDPFGVPGNESSPSSHIEFIVRRNLEHILSVCSVPVNPTRLDQDSPSAKLPRIALTCGDMSCHLVSVSASFFAFKFLISIASRLKIIEQANPDDPYIRSLSKRIADVCNGHLKWLSSLEVDQDSLYKANYWVTAKAMTRKTWQSDNSLTNTAYQVLKAGEYSSVYNEEKDVKLAKDAIATPCVAWIMHLEKLDKRACSVWPRAQQAGTNTFRLDDNVWIWKALETIECLSLWPGRENGKKALRPLQEIQQEMLRRFTAENETSKTRMLAVTRSSRETRFLFHARDTALIYAHDWGFLSQQTAFRRAWENTLEAQALYVGNQDALWYNTLRYALAVMIGVRERRVNIKSPSDLAKSSLHAILMGTHLNGICAGRLDEITKEPAIIASDEEQDYYYHTSFEIPYILLYDAMSINKIYEEQSDLDQENQTQDRQSAVPPSKGGERLDGLKPQPKHQQVQSGELARNLGALKKTVPSPLLFDSSRVVEIDDEWLYNYPSFLSNEKAVGDEDVSQLLESLVRQETEIDADGQFFIKAAKEAQRRMRQHIKWYGDTDTITTHRSTNIDVPKSKRRRKDARIAIYTCSNSGLGMRLTNRRDVMEAKKRFIWLANADAETALVCYVGTSDVDKPAIAQFFDRHWHHEVYFFDDTSLIRNTWETEFHLSFHRLLDARDTSLGNTQTGSENSSPSKGQMTTKVSMGFHFIGDFFDRYWTCHFIQDPSTLHARVSSDEDWVTWSRLLHKLPFPHSDREQGWRQRKILELYLFELILNTLLKWTHEILSQVREELGVQQRQGGFLPTSLSSEDYFFSSIQWHQLQIVLQDVDENLDDVKLEVSKWETREKDRGQEKPRWTRNDERKYGMIVRKALGSTEKAIRNLHSIHVSVKSLKETLIRSQEQLRQDISLRGSEDIRFFTYVTVVFLPLGFASSIFSMSATPSPDLVASLVVCATVSLVITVFALFNAKTIGYLSQRGFSFIDSYSRSKMERSVLIQGNQGTQKMSDEEMPEEALYTQAKSKQDSNKGIKVNPGGSQILGTEIFPRFWFLVVYAVLELPAKRVATAYHILANGTPKFTDCLYIALGIVCLPFCLVIWLVQIAACNAIDLFGILLDLVTSLIPSPPEGLDIRKNMRWLALPLTTLRPMRHLRLRLKARRELKEKEKKEEKEKEEEEKKEEEKKKEEKKEEEKKEEDEEKKNEEQDVQGRETQENSDHPLIEEQQLSPTSVSPPPSSEAAFQPIMHGGTFPIASNQGNANREGVEASSVRANSL